KEKQHAYKRDDGAFLQQRPLERVDGAVNQVRSVVDRYDRRPLRQAAGDLADMLLDVGNDRKRVLAVALAGDAGRNFALAVKLGDAAAFVRCQLHARHILEQYWCPALRLEHDLFEIRDAAQIPSTAHHVLGLGQLHHATADIHVGSPDGILDFGQWNVEGLETAWVNDDRVLPDETADACDFGYTLCFVERQTHLPVLRAAQSCKSRPGRHHGGLVDRANAAAFRADVRGGGVGHLPLVYC